MTMLYKTRLGESPALIARKFGMPLAHLISANPHKPTTVVAGQRTWQSLHHNESVHVPGRVGALGDDLGMLGAVAPAPTNAPHAMIKQGSSGADVALWQTIIGVTADGIFGPNTAAATKSWQGKHGLAADGIVGPKTWTAALQGAIPAAAPPVQSTGAPAPAVPIPAATSSGQPTIKQGSTGTAVKQWQQIIGVSADGIFGAQTTAATKVWQAAHGLTADGIVGPKTWNAASAPGAAIAIPTSFSALPVSFPTTAIPPLPDVGPVFSPPPPPVSFPVPGVVPLPPPVQQTSFPVPPPVVQPSSVPLAVQALSSIDPCDPANSSLICQAQSALGVSADGKYGPQTAAAARRVLPGAPGACSPRPSWWTPTGSSNCPGAAPPPSAAQTQTPTASSATPSAPSSSTQQPMIMAPEDKKGISTGAMIAGAIGAAALVGLVAVAASGKKSTSRSTTTITRRAPAHKSPHKPAHKKSRKKK